MSDDIKTRGVCFRGHALRSPNLAGDGVCLACQTAKHRVRRNPTLVMEDVADRLFTEITATKTQEATEL